MQNAPLIKKIAEKIVQTELKRRKLARSVKDISQVMLKTAISPDPLNDIKIAAVDGGIVKKSLHGMDCMLVRAAAVCFHYVNGKVAEVKYYPSKSPPPHPEVYESLSEIEWNHFSSLHRLREEIGTAIACIDVFSPSILLLDGMVLPHYMDKPTKASPLYQEYENVLSLYRALFQKVKEKNIALAGVIEDSRNVIFCEYVMKEMMKNEGSGDVIDLLGKTRDSNLLYWILEKGEMSLLFPVESEEISIPINTFYLKTAAFDRPIRIEYLTETIDVKRLAPILLAISGLHSGYGLPIPLIEADNVAKLPEEEMDNFYSHILSLTGRLSSTLALRREQRPF